MIFHRAMERKYFLFAIRYGALWAGCRDFTCPTLHHALRRYRPDYYDVTSFRWSPTGRIVRQQRARPENRLFNEFIYLATEVYND